MLNRETEEYVDRLRQVSPDAQPMWWFDCDTCRGQTVHSLLVHPHGLAVGGRSRMLVDEDGHATCPACR